MKSALKSASHKKISNGRQPTKSEIYFEVKPYTQNVIFSDNILQDNFDSSLKNQTNDELEDLDRNEVHNLEKWIDYNKHKQITSMFKEVKIKQLEKEKKLKEMSEKNIKASYYRFPEVRPFILNTILDQEKHVCYENNLHPQNQRKFLKSIETIKNEANKMLVNELIYRKVSNQAKLRAFSENNRPNTSIQSGFKMPTQNNEAVEPEMTNNTINNFKHLQQLFLTYKQNQIINYPDLMARIQQSNQHVEKLFDYSSEMKRIEDGSKRNLDYEAQLLEEFDALKSKIMEKKHMQKKIRMQNAANNSKLTTQNETNERIRFRLQNNFESLIAKVHRNSSQISSIKAKKDDLQGNFSIEEFLQIQKLNEEKEKAEKMIKAEIEKIKSDTKSNNSKLEMIEKEAVDLRQKKLHYQLELKDIYLIRLKEELKQENNDSITWILKAFWRIDKEFSNENFPSDLDSENINFLFKLAQMEQDLIDLKSKQRFEILSIAKDHGLKNSKGLLNREYTERLTEIQNKLKFMKKEKFQIKKTVANKVQHRTAIEKKLEEDLLEDYFKKCLGDLNIDDLEPKGSHNGEIKTEHKNYELQIKNIIEMIDQIKTKEILRMFHKFKHASLGDNDHKILSKILRILFGFKKNNEIMAMADFEKFKDDIRNKDMGLSSAEKNRPKTSKTFSSEKTRVDTAKTKKSNENNKERKEEIMKDYEGFFNKITIDSQTVNYKYNLNYNYTPKTNLEDDNRVFYTNNRVQTAKANKIVHF